MNTRVCCFLQTGEFKVVLDFSNVIENLWLKLKELYKYPEVLRPSISGRFFPIETYVEGVKVSINLAKNERKVMTRLDRYPKATPPKKEVRETALKYGYKLEEDHITTSHVILFTIMRGGFDIHLTSALITTEKAMDFLQELLKIYITYGTHTHRKHT